MRVLGFRRKGGPSFLARVDFPLSVAVDVNDVPALYVVPHKSGWLDREPLVDKTQRLLNGLACEFDVMTTDAVPPAYAPAHAYSCRYADASLPVLVDNLLSVRIRGRVILSLEPRKAWRAGFLVGTDAPADAVLGPLFSDVRDVRPRDLGRALAGRFDAPYVLKTFTVPRLQGVDELPASLIGVPSSFLVGAPASSIRLGDVLDPLSSRAVAAAWLSPKMLNRHLGVYGASGMGKTNAARQVMRELHARGVPFLVFEPSKKGYRGEIERIPLKIYNFSTNPFRFNPLKPMGDPAEYAKRIAEILAEVASGGVFASGAFSKYVKVIDALYRERGVYAGSRTYPTLLDLKAALEAEAFANSSNREKEWVSTALKVLESLSIGACRDALNVQNGISFDALLAGNAVLELDELGDARSKAFLMSVILEKIRGYRLAKGVYDRLLHVIIMEEAQTVLAKDQQATSILSTTFREFRGLGEGVVTICQSPSQLSKDVLANTNALLVFKLNLYEDKLAALSTLGLPPGAAPIFDRLGVGEALLKTKDIALLRVPRLTSTHVPDEAITADPLPARKDVNENHAARNGVTKKLKELNPFEWRVLALIAEAEAVTNSQIAAVTRTHSKDVGHALGRLLGLGLVRYAKAKKMGPDGGKPPNVFFLFPDGEVAYQQRTGWSHERARARTAQAKHSEMKVALIPKLGFELRPHQTFDVYGEVDGRAVAVEIETGSNKDDQLLINVRKSLDALNEARFIAADARVANWILQMAARVAFDDRRVVVLHLATYDEFLASGEWTTYEVRVSPTS